MVSMCSVLRFGNGAVHACFDMGKLSSIQRCPTLIIYLLRYFTLISPRERGLQYAMGAIGKEGSFCPVNAIFIPNSRIGHGEGRRVSTGIGSELQDQPNSSEEVQEPVARVS